MYVNVKPELMLLRHVVRMYVYYQVFMACVDIPLIPTVVEGHMNTPVRMVSKTKCHSSSTGHSVHTSRPEDFI